MRRWRALLAAAALLLAPALLPATAQASDGLVEVSGVVAAMPATGFVGEWKIGTKTVVADAATIVDQSDGKATVGATVEAKAVAKPDGTLLATRIEVTRAAPGAGGGSGGGGGGAGAGGDDEEHGAELVGTIDALPAGGLVGTWTVAGHSVIVLSTTRLEQEHGGFAVGARVEVHGLADTTGTMTASQIELLSGGMPAPVPPDAAKGVELVGKIDALPTTGLVGDWTVTGRVVHVSATTVLDDHGAGFAVGNTVEVHGVPDAGGALAAVRIERTGGRGAAVPALEFWGTIESVPDAAVFPVGLWKIGGKLVNVTAATKLDVEDGPLVVGAIAEVSGWPQPDGVVDAREIESRHAIGEMPGSGDKAVEFVSDKLGHFFVTAFPAEIAALDAGAFGGAWRRTGESFKVGGGKAAVCRFYGMPPAGPDSHFFTVDATECGKVMRDYGAWTFEGHAFSVTPAVGGTCPAGTVPVRRFYNNPAKGDDMNHRYVVSDAVAAEMRARGWIDEGVVMCAAP